MGIPVNSDVSLLSTGTLVNGPVTYKPNLFAGDTFKVGQYATLDLGTMTGEDTVSQLTVNLGNVDDASNMGSTTVNIGAVSETGGSSTITIGRAPTMSANTTIYLGCADSSGQSTIHIGDSINKDGFFSGSVYLGGTSAGSNIYVQGGLIIGSNARATTGCVYTDTSETTPTLKFFNGNEWVSLGGGASGDYLPLSGGSLSGALTIEANVKESQDTTLFSVGGLTESDKFNLITASGNADGHSSVTIGAQGDAEGTDIRAYGSSVSFYTTSGFSLYSTGTMGTINIGPCGDSNSNTVNIGNNDGSSAGSGATTNYVNIGNSSMEGATSVTIGKNSGSTANGTYVAIGETTNTSSTTVNIGAVSGSANSHVYIGYGTSGNATGSAFVNIGVAAENCSTYLTFGRGLSTKEACTTVEIGTYGRNTIGQGGTTYIGPTDSSQPSTVVIGMSATHTANDKSPSVSVVHENSVSSQWTGTVDIGSYFYVDEPNHIIQETTTTTLYGKVVLPTFPGTSVATLQCDRAGQIMFDTSKNVVLISVYDSESGIYVWKTLAFVTE